MNPNISEFHTGVVAPVECLKEGWALIKEQYWLFFGIAIVGIVIGSVVPIILLGPMMCGIFFCLLQRKRGAQVEFGELFKGFDYFVPGLIVQLIKAIPIVVLMVPFYIVMFAVMFSGMPRPGEPMDELRIMFPIFAVEIVFFLVVMVVTILVEMFFMFAFPLVVDRKLSGLEALKLSFRACKANLGGILGLLLLNAGLGIVGVLCCVIGVYFYLPVSFASYAVAYRRVFPDVGPNLPMPPPPPQSWA
jgi:hypothetical protein